MDTGIEQGTEPTEKGINGRGRCSRKGAKKREIIWQKELMAREWTRIIRQNDWGQNDEGGGIEHAHGDNGGLKRRTFNAQLRQNPLPRGVKGFLAVTPLQVNVHAGFVNT